MTIKETRTAMRNGRRVVGCATRSTGGPAQIIGKLKMGRRVEFNIQIAEHCSAPFLPDELTEYRPQTHGAADTSDVPAGENAAESR